MNIQKEFEKSKLIKLTIENPNINDEDEIFYAYIIEYRKKYDYYLIKCHFKLVVNDNQVGENVKSNLFDNKTLFSRWNFLEIVIRDFKDEEYNFNHIAEMNIITIGIKNDKSYDFYIKHTSHAVEWKLNAIVNKNKSLVNKLDRSKP